MARTFRLGAKVHYPITIQRIQKRPGDPVSKQDTILEYSFQWRKLQGDDTRDQQFWTDQTTTVTWASPSEGTLKDIFLSEGQVLNMDMACVAIDETCSHEVQFQGMCGACGKDMTEVNWATQERDTARAPINMTHDQTSLTVSQATAQRHATDQQTRLLENRKLSLVVDLDQTIIHACIEPTVGEWQRDPENPNYNAVKDVKSFQLNDEGGPRGITSSCWYYIKLRPGLKEFLESVSKLYEMHVYTMGTRAYAQNIAKLVDPDQKLFGNRVISRDENGSLAAKNLQRLFPTSTGMVAIIDDRADVWPNNRDNLIKVIPYDFFKGIGDINSSFLPKRQEIAPQPEATVTPTPVTAAPGSSPTTLEAPDKPVSALEEFVKMSSGDDPALRKKQATEQEQLLKKQLTERPLLHLQEQLDKEDETGSTKPVDLDSSDGTQKTEPTPPKADEQGEKVSEEAALPTSQTGSQAGQPRHNLLRDDDNELHYLTQHLAELHTSFYEEYDHKRNKRRGHLNPHAHDHPKRSSDIGEVDLSMIPDVGHVLSDLKRRVLRGSTIVLSGLVPLDVDVADSELGMQVKSFGAAINTRISPRVTHLVISSSRPRTQKVRQAAQIPNIKIVNQNWLVESMSRWEKAPEAPHEVEISPEDRAPRTRNEAGEPGEGGKRGPPGKLILPVMNSQGDETIIEDHAFDSDDEGTSHLENEERDELEELHTYEPSRLQDGESSPIDDMKTFNWGTADQELEDFLNDESDDSDDDDDEDEEVTDEEDEHQPMPKQHLSSGDGKMTNGNTGKRKESMGVKRKLTDDEESDEGELVAKRQKISKTPGEGQLPSASDDTEQGRYGKGEDEDGDDFEDLLALLEE